MKFPGLIACWLAATTTLIAADNTNGSHRLTFQQRLDPVQLKATQQAVQRFARERRPLPDLGVYEDFRAVVHVHAEDSDHTKGTRREVLAAARKTGVRVVLLTDHRGPKPETWNGLREGILFLAGSEDSDGKLRFPNFDVNRKPLPEGELKFLSHIEERYDADTKGFTGMEICNRHTDQVLDPGLGTFLVGAAQSPDAWGAITQNFRAYPDAVFAAGCDYRADIFAKWDRDLDKRHLTSIGANDAHQNVIINGFTFDPYEVSFRNLSTHILARELTEPEIRAALRDGHCYVSHDWLCDPSGFSFGAVNNLGVFPMGDTALLQGRTRLVALTPLPATLKLIYKGQVVAQTNGTNLTFTAKKPGAYRLEAWLDVAGEKRPWIYSNPVYLQEPSFFSMRLPNLAQSPEVEMKKDIAYVPGPASDDSKHKLDLYLPREKKNAPVFLFLHGGAWRFGDRNLYPPLGSRFARAGILTVIPSYRLAPGSPYPAQIEDAASAFAWTMQHIAEYGGDTNRIYIGGHSAGGHLVSLLALDARHLGKHQLSPRLIKGVAALSGVYTLEGIDALSSVFGTDSDLRRDAMPLSHIQAWAPPFLISYCQWDYPTLPAQAKLFHAALRRTGVASTLLFTPKESHISEIIAMTHDDDATSREILRFIR